MEKRLYMARMSDYESIIFETKDKAFDLEKKVDLLEQEVDKLKLMLNDKLVDIEMDLRYLKQRESI